MDEWTKSCDQCRRAIPESRAFYRLRLRSGIECMRLSKREASNAGGSDSADDLETQVAGEAELCSEACVTRWVLAQLKPLARLAEVSR